MCEDPKRNNTDAVQKCTFLFKSLADCVYTNCYCEENVWHLCKSLENSYPDELEQCYCIFISNQQRAVPLWYQKGSSQADGCVLWDYHVIFIHKSSNGSLVYDLDSNLSFPCPFQTYVETAIRSCDLLKPNFQRFFRVIPAKEFLHTFASDRTHMLNAERQWLKPPPLYPCIRTQDSVNNIQEFISMDGSFGVGKVLNYWQFCDMFLFMGEKGP